MLTNFRYLSLLLSEWIQHTAALFWLSEKLIIFLDSKDKAVLIDLSKPFETINHNLLISNL